MNYSISFLCLIVLLSACYKENDRIVYSDNKSDISAYNLIEPKAAHELLENNPRMYLPIQVSKQELFLKEHIPSAQNVWRPDYGSDSKTPFGGLIAPKSKIQNLLQELGVTKNDTLLLYDIKANVDALRFAWVLSVYNFDQFKIINGGLKNWKQQGLKFDSLRTSKEKTDILLTKPLNESIIATFDDVKQSLTDSHTILIDTREPYEFNGGPYISKGKIYDFKPGAFTNGCIPGAVHLNWSTFADMNRDHRIKSERDLRWDLQQRGITEDKNIIVYCQSGSRSSHTYYVLKNILGFENVKNYDGSWIEWSYKNSIDPSTTVLRHSSKTEIDSLKKSMEKELLNRE